MNEKEAKDALAVERYKTTSALRRAKRLEIAQKSELSTPVRSPAVSEVVVVRLAKDAKPLSALGGVVEVLGPSRIHIPEYKKSRD